MSKRTDPASMRRALELVTEGEPLREAAALAGVSRSALQRAKAAREAGEPFPGEDRESDPPPPRPVPSHFADVSHRDEPHSVEASADDERRHRLELRDMLAAELEGGAAVVADLLVGRLARGGPMPGPVHPDDDVPVVRLADALHRLNGHDRGIVAHVLEALGAAEFWDDEGAPLWLDDDGPEGA